MMGTIGEILKAKGQEMVIGAAEIIVEDMRENLNLGLELDNENTPMNSDVQPTIDLVPERIAIKKAYGGIAPETPRIMTGAMRDSITYQAQQGEAVVDISGDKKKATDQNDGGKGPWIDEEGTLHKGPPYSRPFWGVTRTANNLIQDFVDAKGDQMVAEMNNVVLPTVTVSV